ncbi:MAG: hypothetical protein ACRDNI_04850 [Gaiellaceae bacterium]
MDERDHIGGGRESVERVELRRQLVAATREGARELARWYWEELERSTRGLVRAQAEGEGTRLVLGRSLTLLRFGVPEIGVAERSVEARYPILGGALASRPGGSLTIAQRADPVPQLEVTVTSYHPSLAGRGSRFHRGLLYTALQAPLHRSVSRRFLTRTAGRSP